MVHNFLPPRLSPCFGSNVVLTHRTPELKPISSAWSIVGGGVVGCNCWSAELSRPGRPHDERQARDCDAETRLVPHGRAEDFLHQTSPTPARRIARALRVAPAVGPDRMRHAAEGDQALVVALLVAVVDRRARKQAVAVVLVGALRRDAHVGQPGGAAIRGTREVDVGHEAVAGNVVLRVVVRGGHVAADRIDGEPLIEAVRPRYLVANRRRRRPARAGVVGKRQHDGRVAGRVQVHPGAIQPAAVRAARTIGVAGGGDQGAADRFSRDADIEGDYLRRYRPLWAPAYAAVEGTV